MLSSHLNKITSRTARLKGVVKQIRQVPAGTPVSGALIFRLVLAWGNYGYSASVRYLQQVERLFRESDGSVLECGSGATTLLAALLAEKYDRYVWTFENHEEWAGHLKSVLREFSLGHIRVCHTPLRSYADYEWYELPLSPLPNDFGLVICDGPPGGIQGGRYGLMPVMSGYLRPDCRILLDDTHRRNEKALICRWSHERRLISSTLGATGRCAEIVFA
jgi:hypothetical protein